MELGGFDFDRGEFGGGDEDALRIARLIEFAANGKSRIGLGGADQIDDHTVADEGLGTPVDRDEGEHAVLDLIPLAGAGRQVVDFDVDVEFVGQTLELEFPEANARAIAPAAVRRDDQLGGYRIAGAGDLLPPAADALNREGGGIVVHADADPAVIGSKIINPIGDRSAQFLDQKVMNPALFRISLGSPFAAIVLEVTNQPFLLGIDRYDGLLLS